ncbi:hypothetical protein Enr13x_12510 [Stieleria neptunia]|uniref:Uncharacterized protein n=1 Tax=Stieleria neptunia TaxID=2527979 RepID=A0A518HKN0_9BACT|nr:hypothetical protein [Stieleria neptunia]QDV41412.1 hypothetical protein Enr13x_12510 [Stieleria neptunia]
MGTTYSETPAGLVAVLVAAKRTGDATLAAAITAELKTRFDITIKVGPKFLTLAGSHK